MKRNKLLVLLCAILCLFTCASIVPAFAGAEKAISFSEIQYDEETGELTYLKASYSKNTYTTTNVTTVDANGAPVDVSDDAEYIFLPCSYYSFTDETTVSIKYKNAGVTAMPMHVEYGAGINADGVDYPRGFKYICVDAIGGAWNVSYSKSVDGYDVLSVSFGGYAAEIYDINLLGFRLYLDYAKTVNSSRSIEILGVTVHESNQIPSFASDPKGCRFSKFTDEDGDVVNGQVEFEGEKQISAKILDFSTDFTSIELNLTFNGESDIQVLLDDEVAYSDALLNGNQTVEIELEKASYQSIKILLNGAGTLKFTASLLTRPYVDSLSGSGYTVSKLEGGQMQINYSFAQGWNKLSGAIRKYSSNYDSLKIVLNLSHPIVIGIQIDSEYLHNHWSHTEPTPAGDVEYFFDITSFEIGDSSSLVFWLDPAITGYAGVSEEKTVIVKELSFINSQKMTPASINIAEKFEFVYDGKQKSASGATTNSGETLIYEYKLEGDPDKAYDSEAPTDAGVYDVRVTSPLNASFGTTYAYSKLIISKITPKAPTLSDLKLDFVNEQVNFDSSVLAVSKYEDFSYLMQDGGNISFGIKLFYKFIDSTNYNESAVSVVELTGRESGFTVEVDYARETTAQNVTSLQEYSTDGLNWTVGQGKKVKLEPGKIYLFRTRATSSSFASDIFYISASYRPEFTAEIELESTNSSSITLKAIEGAEYRLSDTVWQDSPTFDYLSQGMVVEVFIRLKCTSSSFASVEVSASFTVGKMPAEEQISSSSNQQISSTEKKGCGSSLSLGGGFALAMGVAICYMLKKRGLVK